VDKRRALKIMASQLCVQNDMIRLVEELETPYPLLNERCPPKPGNEARGHWKALKAEYRKNIEEFEADISTLLTNVEQLNLKRDRITQLVKTLEQKREKCQELELSLQKAQKALEACDDQLTLLRAETKTVLSRVHQWQLYKDKLQERVSLIQSMMSYNVRPVSKTELSIDLKPYSSGGVSSSSGYLELLNLLLKYKDACRHSLQVHHSSTGALEESLKGRSSERSADLLTVMEHHGEMMAEIQALHSRFAIDWRPSVRRLVYLKSSSVVCTLAVEEGYPSSGKATLVSVRKEHEDLDRRHLQHPKELPSLTDWLEFLFTNPLI